ncbi:rhomboid family intramembrane serine protease [Haloplasma contractile]|uniref:Rhomboid domain containing protein n=1 Tax=Haloplasma contractile SSD-17B TaxID=1033810 RepID=U2EFX7_9MOLU|nr:rhomboid family intramembrane serine protease [Haloplasma contractile]ERJ13828.1 Rhomboid domain containing protein [Haloplasma contractile SSD-17B]
MDKKKPAVDTYEIRYSDKEELALNIVNYFLKKENFSLFNIPEKMLENFSHPLYDLVFISTERLHSSEAIVHLEHKLKSVKKKMTKTYLIPSPSILFISVDCNIKFDVDQLPKNVEFVSIDSVEDLLSHPIILEDFPAIKTANLTHSFSELSQLINKEGILHLRKIRSMLTYTDKPWGYILLISLNVLWFLSFAYLNVLENQTDQIRPFALTQQGVQEGAYWLFITNSFVSRDIFQLIAAAIFTSYFGRFTEKLYGTMRFLGIALFSIGLSNSVSFALTTEHQFGFFPIVIGLVTAIGYASFNYRRYLMMSFRKMVVPFIGIFFIYAFITSYNELIAISGAFLGGLLGSVILGLPKKKSKSILKRILFLLGYLAILSISILTGLE